MKYSRGAAIKIMTNLSAGLMLSPYLSFFKSNAEMLKRKIPSTAELLPVVGLGTWQQFDVSLSEAEKKQLTEVLHSMIKNGGKLIDSSPMYGRSEEVLGELSSDTGIQNKFFYATKVWTSGKEEGIRQMNDSFKKMEVKTMDLMQVHNLVDYKTHLETLKQWKAEGKVRYVGITHYTESSHEKLEQLVLNKDIDFVQFNYSIRIRNAEARLLDTAADKGVAVIINEPFETGSLFSFVKGKKLPEWAADNDINSWGQYFLKYILSHPAVNCVIPGTSNPKHVIDNMQAGYGRLPDKKLKKKMIEYLSQL